MTHKENIMAILECYFAGFKEEIIDRACNRILEQEPCEDIISRQIACDALRKYKSVVSEPDAYDKAFDDGIDTAIAEIEHNIPPITPQQKIGHWIATGDYFTGAYESIDYVKCSCCYEESLEEGNYCPNCGAEMVEPQEESE